MHKLESLQSFSFEGNVSQGWELWLKHFVFYLTATERTEKNDDVRTSVLLTFIGQKRRYIYEAISFKYPGDGKKLILGLEKFSEYWNPR